MLFLSNFFLTARAEDVILIELLLYSVCSDNENKLSIMPGLCLSRDCELSHSGGPPRPRVNGALNIAKRLAHCPTLKILRTRQFNDRIYAHGSLRSHRWYPDQLVVGTLVELHPYRIQHPRRRIAVRRLPEPLHRNSTFRACDLTSPGIILGCLSFRAGTLGHWYVTWYGLIQVIHPRVHDSLGL